MKKFFLALLAVVFAFAALAGCDDGELKEFSGIKFENKEFVYDGEAKSIFVENLPEGAEVTYDNNGKTEVGQYTVTAKIEAEGYKTLTLTALLTIAANQPDTPDADEFFESVRFENASFVYDGTEKRIEAADLPAGTTVEYEGNGKINAGVYSVSAFLKNGEFEKSFAAVLTIEKADAVISGEAVQTFVYDGAPKCVTAILNHSESELEYNLSNATSAGTYTVIASADESANYKAAQKAFILTIEKAETVITAEDVQEFLYDGTAKSALAALNHSESIPVSETKTEVGEYTVKITAPESVNYKAAVKSVTLKILINLDFVTFPDKTVSYSGGYQGIYVVGLQEGMSVEYSQNRRLNVGSNEAHATVTVDATGESKELSAIFTIESVPLTVKVKDVEMVIGRDLPEFSVQTTGLVGMDKLSALGTLTFNCETDGKTLGSFPVTAEGLTSENYDITYQPGVLSVINVQTDLAAGGLHLNAEGKTVFDGEEINWLGVNFYPMVNGCFSGSSISETKVAKVFSSLELLAEHKVKVIRFNLGFFYSQDWANGYFSNPEAYYDLLERIFDKAAECNIGLVPSFFWTSYLLDYFGELYVPAFENAASNNSKTLSFMLQFTEDIVGRFSYHPAIMMWEFGNEYNLSADLPNWSEQPGNAGKDPALCKPTLEIHTQVLEVWADTIRANDSYGRLISSGDAEYRASNYHQHIENSWATDSYDEHLTVLGLYHPGKVDSVSIHVYGNSDYYSESDPGRINGLLNTRNWEERLSLLVEMAAKLKKSCYVGEAGFSYSNVNHITMTMLENHYKAIIAAVRKTKVPMIMFWNYDPNTTKVDGQLNDRGSGTEFSWNENWEKGQIILNLIKNS